MAVATWTDEGLRTLLDAALILQCFGPVKVMLMRGGHVFAAGNSFAASVSGDEPIATGYARQLATVSGITFETDGSVIVEVQPTDFGIIGGAVDDTLEGCYLMADTGDDGTSPLLMCYPFETTNVTDGTNVTVNWHQKTLGLRNP